MNVSIPSMSSRRQKCSTRLEWFISIWYVADSDRHATAINMKTKKAMKSTPLAPGYLLAKDCCMYHSPSRNRAAGMRWE